ncbi:MAG: redox-regulated ATPase YchF [Candidatus Methanomethylicus sp.]|nr:redox-regulated ATPase YchF [Candidatus Methanomethylicus sp.]
MKEVGLLIAGIVGKTNVGKSTFFCASTLAPAKTGPYPFVTIEPNRGIASIRVNCVCKDLNVKDNPRNALCINGIRWVPVELIDVAGLVPDAHKGKGLGNKFLDDLRQADGFIHVIDAAGATDANGNLCPPGTRNPSDDVKFLENEITMWMLGILMKDWDRIVKGVSQLKEDPVVMLTERLTGLMISRKHILTVIKAHDEFNKRVDQWTESDLRFFVDCLRRESKPMVIAANKIDLPKAETNIAQLKSEFKGYTVIGCAAEAEFALRQAAKKGLISYMPGDSEFRILDDGKLSDKQKEGLKKIGDILKSWGSTGIQESIEAIYKKELKMMPVFPVEDANKYTDHKGNILPDVFLIQQGTTARGLAYRIHTDLGEGFLYAVDAKTGQKISEDYQLKDRDVVKIVSAKGVKG